MSIGRLIRRSGRVGAASLYSGDERPLAGIGIKQPYLGASAHIADIYSNQFSNTSLAHLKYGFLQRNRSHGDPYAATIPLAPTWELSPQVASILGVLDTFKLPKLDSRPSNNLDLLNIRRCREAARKGDLSRAQLFYARLHCSPPPSLMADLLAACAERSLLGDAVSLYTDAAKLGVTRTERVFTELLATCCAAVHPARAVWVLREALSVARTRTRQSVLTPLSSTPRTPVSVKEPMTQKAVVATDKQVLQWEKDAEAEDIAAVAITHDGVLRLGLLCVRFLATCNLKRSAAAQGIVAVLMMLTSAGLIRSPFIHSSSLQATKRRAVCGSVATHWMPREWDVATKSAVVTCVNMGLLMRTAGNHFVFGKMLDFRPALADLSTHPTTPTAIAGNTYLRWISGGGDARTRGLPARLKDDILFEVHSGQDSYVGADKDGVVSPHKAPSPFGEALGRLSGRGARSTVSADPKTDYLNVYLDATGLPAGRRMATGLEPTKSGAGLVGGRF